MSKAEEIHYKAVVAANNQEPPKDYYISAHADHFNGFVEGFIEGYYQAEEDFELTLEDIKEIYFLFKAVLNEWYGHEFSDEGICREVLKRFKEKKEEV